MRRFPFFVGIVACMSLASHALAQATQPPAPRATNPPVLPPPPEHWQPDITLLGPHAGLSPDRQLLAAESLAYLSHGMEKQADDLLSRFVDQHPDDQKALFLRAVIIRSRNNPAAARPLFEKAVQAGKETPEGRCAALMLNIDIDNKPSSNFNTLADLARKNHENLSIQWLTGIAAHKLQYFAEGLDCLRDIVRQIRGGPVLARKIYADLLEKKFEDDPSVLQQVLNERKGIMELEPSSWSYGDIARTCLLLKLYDDADQACAIVMKYTPSNAEAWKTSAQVLYARARYPQAIEKCQKALELTPQLDSAHVVWALCLEKLGKPAEALDHYKLAINRLRRLVAPPFAAPPQLMDSKKILALPPDAACAELLKYLSAGRQFPDAEEMADNLVDLHPQDPSALFFNGLLIRSRFEAQRAAPFFQRLLQVDAKSPHALCAASLLLIDAGKNTDEAFDQLCDLAYAHPQDPLILWSAAIASRTLDRNPEGVKFYSELVQHFDIGPPLVHQTFGNVLDGMNYHELALAHRKLTVALEPAGWSYQGLANTYSSLRLFEEANAAYGIAIRRTPDSALYWETWGNGLRRWGHYDDAIVKLQEAIRLDPDYAMPYRIWGLTLESQGKPDDALVKYRQAIKLDPNDGDARWKAANLLEKRGDAAAAAEIRRLPGTAR